jgi:hypothetical protein
MWKFKQSARVLPKLDRPILVEGLPGIGNVGKVAVDFIIDKLDAVKIFEITSDTMPHSVFVNEDNMVEMPTIELYYKKSRGRKKDLLLLTGDVQPSDEVSCHRFCNELLKAASKLNYSEIITLGGIGLQDVPKKPKVFCTGNDSKMIARYCKGTGVSNDIYGVVGPIIGASGLLLGLSKKPAITLLAETLSHPLYLGIKGAREVLKVLNSKLKLEIKLKDLDKEIKNLESEIMQKTKELSQISKETALKICTGYIGK